MFIFLQLDYILYNFGFYKMSIIFKKKLLQTKFIALVTYCGIFLTKQAQSILGKASNILLRI